MRSEAIMRRIFGEIFNSEFKKIERKRIHQILYILQYMGVVFGDYGFRWDGKNIFSSDVESDIEKCIKLDNDILEPKFTEHTNQKISLLKDFIENISKTQYQIFEALDMLVKTHVAMKNDTLVRVYGDNYGYLEDQVSCFICDNMIVD